MELRLGYKNTEVGVIPEEWHAKLLGEIGAVRMCKRIFKHQTREVGDVPFYKIGTFGGVPDAFIPRQLFDEFKNKFSFPRKGDVLISAAGTIGRTVVYDGAPAYFQDSNIVWIENDPSKATNEFLQHYYRVTKWVTAHGGTVARLYNDNLKNKIYVALPPIAEQRAIAEALGDADALLAGLDRLIAKKRDLKQAAMQQLLTGKIRLPGFRGEWQLKRLGEVADMTSGGTPLSAITAYYGGNIPWVSIADMTRAGKFTKATEKTLTPLGLANSTAQIFPDGTILYAMYASLGECSIAEIPVCTSQAILGISPKNGLQSEFLYYFLTSIKASVKSLGQQGTQSNINKGIVQNFSIRLPANEEQTAIATVLSDMDAEIAALEARRDKTRNLKQAMMQELLTGRTRLV